MLLVQSLTLTPESRARVMNVCLKLWGVIRLVIPAFFTTFWTIRFAALRSIGSPQRIRKSSPDVRVPRCWSNAHDVRGGSGIASE